MAQVNREARRRARRKRTVAGLSALALSGLFATYLQALRSPSAYATTNCTVTTGTDNAISPPSGSLRACINAVETAGGGTITFAVSSVTLATELPPTHVSFSLDGGANGVVINGGGSSSDFRFLKPYLDHRTLNISHVTFQNFNGTTDKGGVLYVMDQYATVNLTDVTAQDNYSADDGGFLYWDDSYVTLTVTDSYFTRNETGDDGGVFYIDEGGQVTLTRSTFKDNVANTDGGVLYTDVGNTTITDSTFTGNDADYGGALWLDGADFVISGSTFESNTASEKGSVLYAYEDDSLTISDSTFRLNTANKGTLYSEAGDPITVTGSVFDQNTASAWGAGIYGFDVTNVSDSEFTNNTAGYGAAIYDVGDLTLTNVLFANNDVTMTGGVIYKAGQVTATNTTFIDNSALGGGAVATRTGDITLTNSSVLNNTATAGDVFDMGASMTLNFSTIAGNTATGGAVIGLVGYTLTSNASVISSAAGTDNCSLLGTTVTDQYTLATDATCSLSGTGSADSETSGSLAFQALQEVPVNGVLQTVLPMSASSSLVQGAPSGDLGTGITTDQVGTTRDVGSFTIGARQFGAGPEAPTALRATPGDGEAAIAFTAGAPGSRPITNYQYTLDGGTTWLELDPADDSSPVTIPGLTNGTTYTIRLRTVTNYGVSSWSLPVNVTPGGSGARPNAPQKPVIAAGSGKVTVSVVRGSGGGTPTSFRVTAYPGGRTCTISDSTRGQCTVTGLTNGTLYTFKAVAINAVGTSVPSQVSEKAQPGPVKTPTPQAIARFLKKGQALASEGGRPVSVAVDANPDQNGIDITGDNFAMGLDGLKPNGTPMNLGADGVLVLANERDVKTNGEGFLPTTDVNLYVDPETREVRSGRLGRAAVKAIYVGTVKVKADGTFVGTATLPDGISAGTHDLQAVGVSRGNLLRVMTLGVYVTDRPGAVRDLAVDSTSSTGTADLSWRFPAGSKVAGVDAYKVDYRPAGLPSFYRYGSVADPYDTVAGLIPGCSYVFRVRAVNGAGAGAPAYTQVTTIPTGTRARPMGDLTCLLQRT